MPTQDRQVCYFPPLPTAGPNRLHTGFLVAVEVSQLLLLCCWTGPSSCTIPPHPEALRKKRFRSFFTSPERWAQGRVPKRKCLASVLPHSRLESSSPRPQRKRHKSPRPHYPPRRLQAPEAGKAGLCPADRVSQGPGQDMTGSTCVDPGLTPRPLTSSHRLLVPAGMGIGWAHRKQKPQSPPRDPGTPPESFGLAFPFCPPT